LLPLWDQIAEHSVNMTHVSPCTYLLDETGSFTAQARAVSTSLGPRALL
jgi:hypothetical protein